jgi:hypothetical protein
MKNNETRVAPGHKASGRNWKSDLAPLNYLFFAVGLLLMGLSFYLMSIGPHDSFPSRTMGPLLLLFDYLVVFPTAIMFRKPEGD